MTAETTSEEERTIQEAAAGLNVAVRSERTPSGQTVFIAVEGYGREMRISPELVRTMPSDHIHATLAAFAVGATEIRFGEKTMVLVTSPRESA